MHSLTEANVSGSVINAYLEGREQGFYQLPGKVKTVLHHNHANNFKANRLRRMAEEDAGVNVAEGSPPDNKVMKSTPSVTEIVSSPSSCSAPSPVLTNISSISSSSLGTPSAILQHCHVSPIAPMTLQNAMPTVQCMPSAGGKTSNDSFTGQTITAAPTSPSSYASHSALPIAHVQPIPRTTPISQVTPNFDVKPSSDNSFIKTSVFDSSGITATTTPNFPGFTYNHSLSYGSGNVPSSLNSVTYPASPCVGVDSSYTHMPVTNPESAYSLKATNAVTNVFGQISTKNVPNFSGNTFQKNQIPVQNQSGMSYDYPVLEASFPFQTTNPACDANPTLDTIPGFCDQNLNGGQNGDQILENLLREANEAGPGDMGMTSNYGYTHQYMSDGVTVSATCQVTGGHVNMCQGGVANEVGTVNGGNADVLEILSQFS